MFGKKAITALESELSLAKEKMEKALKENTDLSKKLENAVKEKTDLSKQLENAMEKIGDLEKQLGSCELTELKDKAKQTIVEYEGLKEHYVQKTREVEETRAEVEEGFAREAALKRHDLEEEIQTNKENNQAMIRDTVQTFTGSYLYYLDQIRVLMDALRRAASETGETLFDGDIGNIKGRFADKIAECLQNDTNTLHQNSGDLLLIGTEENTEAEAADAEIEEPIPEETETEDAGIAEPVAEEAAETIPEDEPAADPEEAFEDAAEAVVNDCECEPAACCEAETPCGEPEEQNQAEAEEQ